MNDNFICFISSSNVSFIQSEPYHNPYREFGFLFAAKYTPKQVTIVIKIIIIDHNCFEKYSALRNRSGKTKIAA